MKAGSAHSARGEAGDALLQAMRMSEVPENQPYGTRKNANQTSDSSAR
jgi:hypothetical protein